MVKSDTIKSQKQHKKSRQTPITRNLQVKGGGEASSSLLQSYFIINGIFAGFCLVQLLIIRSILRDFVGLYFFFIFLIVAFFIVSMLDYFSDRLGPPVDSDKD